MEENSFYVTLPSNSSLETYHFNQSSNFITQLAQVIELNGSWEVGLSEITYPHTFESVASGENNLKIMYIPTANSGVEKTKERKVSFRSGFYEDVQTLVDEINSALEKVKIVLSYSPIRNRVTFTAHDRGTITVGGVEGPLYDIFIQLKPTLQYILGSGSDTVDTTGKEGLFPCDIRAGRYNFFLYSDIVGYQRVGDSYVQLLRILEIKGKPNDVITLRYDRPQYVPVTQSHIENIRMEIKTDQDKFVRFTYGKVIIKLHFRQVTPSLSSLN